jgi:hypothetical protein
LSLSFAHLLAACACAAPVLVAFFQKTTMLDIDIAIVTFKWNDGKEISVEETWALGNGRILLLTAMGILIYCDG